MVSFFASFIIVLNFLVFDVFARINYMKYNNDYEAHNITSIVVAGGVSTSLNEFPYMAAVGYKQFDDTIAYHCGGALIFPHLVITAAHCTNMHGKEPDHVRIGGAPLNSEEVRNQPLEISKIHVHPLYKRNEFYHDIALLELKEESSYFPACLWTNHTIDVENITAIGYGQKKFAGPNTNDLLKTSLSIISNDNCSSYYPPYSKLQDSVVDTQFCAGDFNKVRDTCQGDSGGPVVGYIGEWPYDYPYILGLTSFGQGCASGSPSIYVRVSKYIEWLEEVTNESFTDCYRDIPD